MPFAQASGMGDGSAFCIMIRRVILCSKVNLGDENNRSESESEMGDFSFTE